MRLRIFLTLLLAVALFPGQILQPRLASWVAADEPVVAVQSGPKAENAGETWEWIRLHVRKGRLFFQNRKFDRKAFRVISTISELTELQLRNCQVIDDDLENLAKLSNLVDLDLSKNDISDRGGVHLGKLTKLQGIRLNHTRIGDLTVAAMAANGQLGGVILSDTQVHGDCLAALSQCRELQYLELRGNIIYPEVWPGICTLTSLKSLDISFTTLVAPDLQYLEPLTNLRELSVIKVYGIKDDNLGAITALPLLGSLSVGFAQITNQGVKRLTDLKHLRNLDLGHTAVTTGVLDIIEKQTQWKRVDLSYCNIDITSFYKSSALKRMVGESLGPRQEPDPDFDSLDEKPVTETQ